MRHFKEQINQYVDPTLRYPVKFGDELGNIKLEHETKGDSYWLGKKFYALDCIYDGEVLKCKGVPNTTIDVHGSKVNLLDFELYEKVCNDEEQVVHFSRICKNPFGKDQRMSTHMQRRTVRPQTQYKDYY